MGFKSICATNFGLNHETPSLFFTSQWPFPSWLYLVYSIFFMIYIPAWLVAEGVVNFYLKYPGEPDQQAKFFIYHTNWSYIVLSLVTIARGIGVCWYYRKRQSQKLSDEQVFPGGQMPIPAKIIWVFYNIALCSEVILSIAFYLHAIGLGMGENERETSLANPINIHMHGIGAMYILTNLLISAIPLRIGHFFHTSIYIFIYMMFLFVYQRLGGTNKTGVPGVYKDFNWDNQPMSSLLALGAILIAYPSLWLIFYGIYRLRVFVYEKCVSRKKEYEEVA